MPMYNLLEYSQNYFMASGILCNYCRDEIDDVDDNASDGKSQMVNHLNIRQKNRKSRSNTFITRSTRCASRWKSTTNTTFKHSSHYSTQIS